MSVAFDTYAAIKRLRQAGFTEGQAEALSETLQDGVTGGGLATKADLASLATKAKLAEAKDELKAELAEVKDDLTEVKIDLVWLKRLGALIAALLIVPILRDLL